MRLIDAEQLEAAVNEGLKENPHKDGFARVLHRTEHLHFLDLIRRAPTIAPPSNPPLTLDELREMGGEPVYLVFAEDCNCNEWAIVHLEWQGCKPASGGAVFFDRYGERWLAYRRKPEEGPA